MDQFDFSYFSPYITPDENKKRYREYALRYHPDKNNGDKRAEEKFKAISIEYQQIQEFQKQFGVIKEAPRVDRKINIEERRLRRNAQKGTDEFLDLTPQDIESLKKFGHNVKIFWDLLFKK